MHANARRIGEGAPIAQNQPLLVFNFGPPNFQKLCLSFLQTNNINGPLVSGIGLEIGA